MVKVIGAGLPRTGTASTKAALERLGFGPCYHMFEVMTHPEYVDGWLPAASGQPLDWPRLLEGYNATQDWPASHFWREQAAAFPDAKVLLTVRDPRGWYASMMSLIEMGPRRLRAADLGEPQADALPADAPPPVRSIARLAPLMDRMAEATFGEGRTMAHGPEDEDAGVRAFERHTETVRAGLPADRLLIFDVREGWEPLCRFLDVEVPDEPFPRLNDADGLRSTLDSLMSGDRVVTPFDP